jgi:uncharacterized protein YbjQ (UPF0145 family)
MIITTTDYIPDKEIQEILGIVKGSCLPGTLYFHNMNKYKIAFDGSSSIQLISDAREFAKGQMVQEAQELGADAIINVRFETSADESGVYEVLIYGTAVKIK